MVNKEKIFIRLREVTTIEKAINKMLTPDANYNDKIRAYMSFHAVSFINTYFSNLQFKEYEIYKYSYLPKYLFLILQTVPNTNHPFMLYVNLDDKYLTFILPIGKDQGQVDLNYFWNAIEECDPIELFALFTFIERSIVIRKYAILNVKQFSLIECSNISNCVKKMHEIEKMKVSKEKKGDLVKKYNEYYLNKALNFLKFYFDLLNEKYYDEAFLFLRGDQIKYFKKKRLNTFFKNTKTIIGHLQIFISLYLLMNTIKDNIKDKYPQLKI